MASKGVQLQPHTVPSVTFPGNISFAGEPKLHEQTQLYAVRLTATAAPAVPYNPYERNTFFC